MTNILINFAHGSHTKSRKYNTKTGLDIGGFDEAIEYSMSDIDSNFYNKNRHILEQKRGAGYWLWKPYFILKTLRGCDKDDRVFYCDAGCSFVGSFSDYFFNFLDQEDKGLILFNGAHSQSAYTKMDCFYYMGCDSERYFNATQLTATFQLVRKTDFSLSFYESYVEYCEDDRVLTDSPNECGVANTQNFIDHRHDQSVLTNLKEKHGVRTYEDPSQWGDFHNVREPELKTLIYHHRGTL